MIFDRCYIISYRAPKWSDEEWNKRHSKHKFQVEYFKSKGLDIYVFAQFYDEKDKIEGVTYLEWNGERHLPGEARNVCLKHFYESEQDFMLMLDDEITILEKVYNKSHEDGINFIKEFQKMDIVDFKNIDVFGTLLPTRDAYGLTFEENKTEFQNSWVFKRRPHLCGQAVFLKNLKKYYDKEMYFPENWKTEDGDVLIGEDQAFSINLQLNGFNSFQLQNIVLNDLGVKISTYAPSDKEELTKAFIKGKLALLKAFPELSKKDLLDGKFQILYSKFAKKYNPYQKISINKKTQETLSDFYE